MGLGLGFRLGYVRNWGNAAWLLMLLWLAVDIGSGGGSGQAIVGVVCAGGRM